MQFTRMRLVGRYNLDLQLLGMRAQDRYKLKAADGLGPPDVDNQIESGIFAGGQPQNRQIVLRVGLSPAYSVGETPATLRREIYGLLSPNASGLVDVQFFNGPTQVCHTKGAVSKIEPVLFAKDPEVQITIDCLGPYLAAPAAITATPSSGTSWSIDNVGDVTTGFYVEQEVINLSNHFVIYSAPPGAAVRPRIGLGYDFAGGDIVMIDTRQGQKSVKVKSGGVTYDIIRAFTDDSIWFQLHPGVNQFWSTPATSVAFFGKTVYTPQYWGM